MYWNIKNKYLLAKVNCLKQAELFMSESCIPLDALFRE